MLLMNTKTIICNKIDYLPAKLYMVNHYLYY